MPIGQLSTIAPAPNEDAAAPKATSRNGASRPARGVQRTPPNRNLSVIEAGSAAALPLLTSPCATETISTGHRTGLLRKFKRRDPAAPLLPTESSCIRAQAPLTSASRMRRGFGPAVSCAAAREPSKATNAHDSTQSLRIIRRRVVVGPAARVKASALRLQDAPAIVPQPAQQLWTFVAPMPNCSCQLPADS